MTSSNPATKNLLAFGTNDETALIKAFEETSDCAVYLLCERHIQNTLRRGLKPSSFLQPTKQFLHNTFGGACDWEYVLGLVDSRDIEEFQCCLDALEEKWSQAAEPGKEAYRWFLKNKAQKVFCSLGAGVKEQAG